MELITKIKYVATNSHPDEMQHFIKKSIDLEMRKQEPIRYLANVTIKLVEYEIYALKRRFNTLKMKVEVNIYE